MRERVITFGNEKNLVGVLTEPDNNNKVKGTLCVLILNAGIVHHVGPFRLNVVIARHLASQGYTAFRLDVSGIGDSRPVSGAGYDEEGVINDIQAAMDELEHKKGISEYAVVGLCTGAANAHKVTVVDERIKSAAFLGGYAYPTWRFYMKRYLSAAMDPERVKNLFLRVVLRIFNKPVNDGKSFEMQEDFGWWTLPPKDEAYGDLEKFVSRGVDLLYVYSGEEGDVYSYEEQFKQAFPAIDFKGKIRVIINNEADHTYIMAQDRDRLICQISDWIDECYT
jgi:pimeloyl-ACP methyl ester carboxylesterase